MASPARVPFVTGIILAILVAGILVTSPSAFIGQGATFIDTEGWARTGGGVPVQTTGFLRQTDDIEHFPAGFAEWNMTGDLTPQWENVREFFQADAMISRYYSTKGVFTPAHLFIIDTKYTRVLHSLPASYALRGMEIDSQRDRMLDVTNATWLDERTPNSQIPVVETIFVKRNATTGETTERRIVHYFWVKREAWGVTNHLTWVGTSMVVPPTGDITPHKKLLSNFTTDATAQLFVPDATDVADTVAEALVDDKPLGPVILGGSLAVPALLMGYGVAMGRVRDENE